MREAQPLTLADAAAPAASCAPQTSRCNGSTVEQCSPDGLWEPVEECLVCNGFSYCGLIAEGQALCFVPTCCAPETRCTGARLEICNATATGWDLLQDCGDPQLCSAIEGHCRDADAGSAG